ncbi:MAG: SURF1 family protein [Methylophilaceae bacterium]
MKVIFRPSLFMTIAMMLTAALCIKAGLWQYSKAQTKQALQMQLELSLKQAPVALPQKIVNVESWRYRRVKFAGVYQPRYQILLDNQVDNTVVGYHVLTPMQVEDGAIVLVNRGWIKGSPDRRVPLIDTPSGRQEVEGDIAFPAARFFTLEAPPAKDENWQPVWQNLDLPRYLKAVPFAVQPFVVRLDAKSEAGGFVRNWPPPGNNIAMHLGYAYQWFGFALTLLVIYIVLNVKKVES